MPRYVINTIESKQKKRLIKKYAQKIPINTPKIRGYVTIYGYRKYKSYEEFDVNFHGEIYFYFDGKHDWYDSSIMNKVCKRGYIVSKVRVNRFIRRITQKPINDFVKFFDIQMKGYSSIAKLKWT